MRSTKKSYELWEISFDKQKLIRLSQMSDIAGVEQHIQTIEAKYSYYMFYFSLLYPKPFFLFGKVNWYADFLDMYFLFKMYFY